MSFPGDIANAIWKIVARLLSQTGRVVILAVVLIAFASFYIQYAQIPGKLLLIPALCGVFILLYLAFELRRARKWLLLAAGVAFLAWASWHDHLATKDSRDVRQLMGMAASLRKEDPEGSIKKFEEARSKAEMAKLPLEQIDCLLEIGELKYLRSDYTGAKIDFNASKQLAILAGLLEKKGYALSRLGDIARFEGNTGQASLLLNEALLVFQQAADIKGEAGAYRGLGDVELRRNAARSRQHFEKARALSIQAQDELGEADACGGLGDLNSLVGHTVEARKNYKRALDLYQLLGETNGLGDIHRGLGDLERRLGYFDEAEKYYRQAEAFYQTSNDPGGLADVYRGLGDWAQVKAPKEEARQKYADALNLFLQLRDRNGEAQVHLGIGELDHLANAKAARESYTRAYRIYLNTESKEGQGTALRHLGDLDASLNQVDPARQSYQQATGAYQHVENQIGQAEVLRSTGDLERKLKNLDAARADYKAALELYRAVDHRSGLAQIAKVLGDLETGVSAKAPPQVREAKIEEAQRYYLSALKGFEEADSKIGLAFTLKSLSVVERKQNNFDKAFIDNRKAVELFSTMGIVADAKLSDFEGLSKPGGGCAGCN